MDNVRESGISVVNEETKRSLSMYTDTYNYHMICIVHISRCGDDVMRCILQPCVHWLMVTPPSLPVLRSVLYLYIQSVFAQNFRLSFCSYRIKTTFRSLLMLVVANDDNSQAPSFLLLASVMWSHKSVVLVSVLLHCPRCEMTCQPYLSACSRRALCSMSTTH